MLINHANLRTIFTGFKSTFQRGWELRKPMYQRVSIIVPSNTEIEEYDWLGVAPGMREWLGDRVIHSLASHGFTIKNKDWEQTVGVERNKIEDDRFGVYSPIVMRMGEAAALHPDELVFGDLFNNGNAADHVGYDGVPFFGTTHPHEIEGTVANADLGGAGPRWYLASLKGALKPIIWQDRKKPQFVSKTSLTDDNVFWQKQFIMGADARYNAGYGMWQYIFASNRALDETNFEAAWTALTQMTADNGKPMLVEPDTLIIPSELKFDAKRLINQTLISQGETNIHLNEVDVLMSFHLNNS